MHDYESLSHVKWECKYHVIITPKYRKKILYGQVRKRAGAILRLLAKQKTVEVLEGHAMPDHIHMMLSIPPKYSVAMIIGFLKGKSALWLHREFGKIRGTYGKNFWSRGYFVSTIGLDEERVKEYIRRQDQQDKRTDGNQLDLGW
jgi:putative transposase